MPDNDKLANGSANKLIDPSTTTSSENQVPRERASTISVEEVKKLRDHSLQESHELDEILEGVFCLPTSSANLRLRV